MAQNNGASSTPSSTSPEASGKVSEAADKVKEATGAVREKAGEAAHTMLEKTSGVQEQVRTKAVDAAETRKGALVENARTVKEEIASTAEALRSNDKDSLASMVETASESVESVISYVERTPIDEMARELATQVRQKPLLFAAGMFGVGLVLARTFKPVDMPAPTPELPHSSMNEFGPTAPTRSAAPTTRQSLSSQTLAGV
jgi:uncharacterized protein YjbJ (UPF0337 family)